MGACSGILCFLSEHWLIFVFVCINFLFYVNWLALNRLLLGFDDGLFNFLSFFNFNWQVCLVTFGIDGRLFLRLVSLNHGLALIELILKRLKLVFKIFFVLLGLLGLFFGGCCTGES